MPRMTAHDFDQELLILFDAYVHGGIDRRTFLNRAAKFTAGGVTAVMLLDQLNPKFAEAQVASPEDTRISQEYLEFDSPDGYGKGRGYFVKPDGATGRLPGILVVHENRGLRGAQEALISTRKPRTMPTATGFLLAFATNTLCKISP